MVPVLVRSHVGWGGGGVRPVGTLYGEVQCVMDNVTCVPDPRVQTDTTENIFFPQLRWRGVNM